MECSQRLTRRIGCDGGQDAGWDFLGRTSVKIRNDVDVVAQAVPMEGAKDVQMQAVIGPEEGSLNMTMRLFTVAPGGHTPYHEHNYEHVVRVISGKGAVVDAQGENYELVPGQNVYVEPGEKHQFANPSSEPFQFTCTIPNLDRCRA